VDDVSICGFTTRLAKIFAICFAGMFDVIAAHPTVGSAVGGNHFRLGTLLVLQASAWRWILGGHHSGLVLSNNRLFCFLAGFSDM
jgi:hypothetical protein